MKFIRYDISNFRMETLAGCLRLNIEIKGILRME